MEFAARIFAFFLALSSLAVPCFSETPSHKKAGYSQSTQSRVCDGSGKGCSKNLPKAVVSRGASPVKTLVLERDGKSFAQQEFAGFNKFSNLREQKTLANFCNANAVNLYFLCRQLN